MISHLVKLWSLACSLVVAGLMSLLVTSPIASATSSIILTGQGISAITPVGTFANSGFLPSTGGSLSASVPSVSMPPVFSAAALRASTFGQGLGVDSFAALEHVSLTTSNGDTVTVQALAAKSEATCSGGMAVLHGSATIINLAVNGTLMSVTGLPNQMARLPSGGTMTINFQNISPPPGTMVDVALVVRVTELEVFELAITQVGVANCPAPT